MSTNITWIDEQDNNIGEITVRKAHDEGLWHRISVVYLFNDQGQILIQDRADGRFDHSAAGHVDAGESYLEAAKRELEEELGVSDVSLTPVGNCMASEEGGRLKHRFEVFKCKANPGKLDPAEVKGVFWADPTTTWEEMLLDPEDKKYCGGFKKTLELYLKNTAGNAN